MRRVHTSRRTLDGCRLIVLATLVCLVSVPGLALAQSTIVGVVKDASGAVVPGVTVEAASDALIEQQKSATTNGSGQYRIVDLRPGTYVVTFALAGFQTVRREGIRLQAEFTATVDAVMALGDRQETITVTGEAPTVDVRSAAAVTRLERDVLDQIPTGQNIWEMAQLIPSINMFNVLAQNAGTVGGQGGATQTYMSVRGMTASQNVVLVDGMTVSGLELNGTIQAYFNPDMNQEINYETSGASADRSGGGVTVNMIPREGGNRPSGNFKTNYRPGRWIGDNFTTRLRDSGLRSAGTLRYLSDFTGSQGGPIKRDKLWFFASYHQFNTSDVVPDTRFDDGARGTDDQHIRQPILRLTYQLNRSNKVSGYVEITDKQRSHDMVAQVDPETAASRWTSPNYSTGNVKFTSTLSSRLLFEGGYSMNREYRTVQAQEGIYKERGTPEWYASASRTLQTGGNARTTAPTTSFTHDWPARDNVQSSLSYITGSHQIKVGFQYQWGRFYHFVDANADLTQRYANVTVAGNEVILSNPADVVVRNTPVASVDRLNRDVGIYAQDSWTTKRLTVNYGVRWEHVNAQNDAYAVPAGRFTPERSIPAVKDVPNWFDWAPRFNMVYDLFGTSKTAIKYSLNRYNFAAGTALANSFNTLSSTTRTLPWTDVNGDRIAQGDPVINPDGSYAPCVGYPSVSCEIDMRALRATNGTWFGTPADADVYPGFPRQWSLESVLEVQHELLPRLSMTAGWTRSDDYNLRKTINRFRLNGDYIPFTIFNPMTGDPITVYGIKDTTTRARLAQSGANVEYVEDERKAPYNQYSVEFRARPYRGAQIFGGWVVSRLDSINCGTSRSDLVVNPNDDFYCDTTTIDRPLAQDFRIVASIPVRYGVTLGITYLNNDEGAFQPLYAIVPGTGATATRYPDGAANSTLKVANQPAPPCPTHAGCVPGAIVLPSSFILPLGATSITVPLEPPGVTRRERLQQLDFRLSKTFRVDRLTVAPMLEAYNVLNSDKVFGYQSANYANSSGTYLVPSTILLGRVIGFGASVRW